MAQIKNNQVRGLVNPSFRTRTTTPQMRGTVNMQSAMAGVPGATPFNQSMIPGGQSKIPTPSAGAQAGISLPSYSALGITPKFPQPSNGQMFKPNISTGTPQTGQTSGPAVNSAQNTVPAGTQGVIDTSTGKNSRGGIDKPSTRPEGFFPGVLQQLLGASGSTKEQERARKEMERISAGNASIANDARRVSDEYAKEIARVGGLGAGAVAGNLSTGTNVVGSGNAAIASQSTSQRMSALSDAQQAALKGTEQQLTAQEQAASAFKPSLEASLTQQAQQLSGLGTAAGLGAPVQVQPGSTLVAPVGGEEIAGGLGGWANYTTAQQVQSLIEQYPDAGVVYNPNLTPQQNAQMIQQAIQGSPSYQRGTYGAAGASSYIGGQQLGAAGTLTGQVAQLQTMGAAADSNFNLMLDILKRGGINDMNQPVLNQLQQGLSRGLTSNEDVVAFRSGLQTVRSQYAQILGGGTPTDATQAMAAEKIPDTVSLAALQEVERTMKTMVNNTVAAYNQQIGAYSNQGGGGGYTGGNIGWDSILD